MTKPRFPVVIVGGSIAGLTLAHGLELLGIDYLVLEKRDEIAPQEGTFIGIQPNGARILEQLGLFNGNVEDYIKPVSLMHFFWPDGFNYSFVAPSIVHKRFGFPVSFLERRQLLVCLRRNLPDSKIRLGQSVVRLEEQQDHSVRVYTKNGSCFEADLVVGADGVHSRVRAEMWRLADAAQPGLFPDTEKNGMLVEYSCTYGISSPTEGLAIGEQISAIHDGACVMTFAREDGCVYWFLMEKLDQKYTYANSPRFSQEETARRCENLASLAIFKDVVWGDLWRNRLVYFKTCLEEVLFQRWHWGRIMCIGDSMHKMAPNSGQGANCAIEDVAELLNLLSSSRQTHGDDFRASLHDIDMRLEQYNRMRVRRIQKIDKDARTLVRLLTRDNLLLKLVGRYYLPHSGNSLVDQFSAHLVDSVLVDWLPQPKRSGPYWSSDVGKPSSQRPRFVAAAVLVVFLLGLQASPVRLKSSWMNLVTG